MINYQLPRIFPTKLSVNYYVATCHLCTNLSIMKHVSLTPLTPRTRPLSSQGSFDTRALLRVNIEWRPYRLLVLLHLPLLAFSHPSTPLSSKVCSLNHQPVGRTHNCLWISCRASSRNTITNTCRSRKWEDESNDDTGAFIFYTKDLLMYFRS